MNDELPPDDVHVDGSLSRLSVALRVSGDTLDPDAITRLMGVTPKFAARKGETRLRGGRPVTQRSGIWTYAVANERAPEWQLDDAIVELLNHLPNDLEMWQTLGRTHRVDVFCGLFMGSENQGADVQPQTLRLLADRGLTLELDIYGPPPFETG
ncbi:MAG TPA: DUF4279 domain-containing protein [Gemmatimonadaceae bacterium]